MNEKTKNLIIALAWAVSITALCALGVFRRPELWIEDEIFQNPEAVPGDIVIIGIDEKDINEFGSYSSWDRSIMASALEMLASDPDKRPAVVAIDTMYTGNIEGKEEGDERLAAAAAELGNVITASQATFGTRTTFGSASVIIDDFAVLSYEEPYQALKDVTVQGHINAMYDMDGIVLMQFYMLNPMEKEFIRCSLKLQECMLCRKDSMCRFLLQIQEDSTSFRSLPSQAISMTVST